MQRPSISAENTAKLVSMDQPENQSQKRWEPKQGWAEPCYKPTLKELARDSQRCQVPAGWKRARGERRLVTARQQHMYACENGYAVRNIIQFPKQTVIKFKYGWATPTRIHKTQRRRTICGYKSNIVWDIMRLAD